MCQDAWRRVIDRVDAIFFCRSLPGTRYLFDLWRRRCALGDHIALFGMPTDMTERVRRPVHDGHQSTWSMLDPLLARAASCVRRGSRRNAQHCKGLSVWNSDGHPLTAAETASG